MEPLFDMAWALSLLSTANSVQRKTVYGRDPNGNVGHSKTDM
jgi:hypothetical protein